MHFGMNGSLQLVPRGEDEPPYTRLRLDFDDGDGLAYLNPRRLGGVGICESIERFIAQSSLGPDVLDPGFDLRKFVATLAGSKRDVKVVLMDQQVMAGLGNIYSDEILFQVRIHPETPARDLRSETVARLFDVMHGTLKLAIDCGAGSERGVDQLPKNFLLPRRHRGDHCPRCGTTLATAKRSGRTSYYCPQCQQK
jgi:formamidopyrimidine-DNA glycosylase